MPKECKSDVSTEAAAATVISAAPLKELPTEMWVDVMSCLRVEDLPAVRRTSRFFREVTGYGHVLRSVMNNSFEQHIVDKAEAIAGNILSVEEFGKLDLRFELMMIICKLIAQNMDIFNFQDICTRIVSVSEKFRDSGKDAISRYEEYKQFFLHFIRQHHEGCQIAFDDVFSSYFYRHKDYQITFFISHDAKIGEPVTLQAFYEESIGNSGTLALAEFLKSPNCALISLDLSMCAIGNSGALALAEALGSPNCKLTSLNLSGNEIDSVDVVQKLAEAVVAAKHSSPERVIKIKGLSDFERYLAMAEESFGRQVQAHESAAAVARP